MKVINRNIDKIADFSLSFILLLWVDLTTNLPIAIFSTLVIGVVKECYDERRKGKFSKLDILANVLGILTAILYLYLK